MPATFSPAKRGAATGILLAGAVLTAGCGTLQARLPDGFAAQATALAVTGHSPRRFNEPIRIGPYSALEMREGATFSWSIPFGSVAVRGTSQRHAFTLVARDQPPVEVQCLTRTTWAGAGSAVRRVEVDLTALDGELMVCGLKLEGMPVQGMTLQPEGLGVAGTLDAPWGSYAIESLSHYEGSKWRSGIPTGYRIASGGQTLAVVDVVNAGRVHLANAIDPEQRVYFAAAAAALLLLDPALGE
jgi:hypothetical protein